MSAARRTLAQRTLALFPLSSIRVPSAVTRSRLTNASIPSFLSCRRHLSIFSDSPVPSASSTVAAASSPSPSVSSATTTSTSSSSSSSSSSAPPVDNRWSHILDPNNPPKLTLAHYALLNKIPNSRADASAASQPPTSATPGLDHAIHSLQRMITNLGQDDPAVRQEIIAMQQQLTGPQQPTATQAADSIDSPDGSAPLSFFNPTTKLKCRFCTLRRTNQTSPQYAITYTNVALLHQFINLRGMLYGRRLTGNCGRHQRQIGHAVKRARIMGLLSFTSNWRLPEGWAEVEGSGGMGLGGGGGIEAGEVGVAGGVESGELSYMEELEETKVGQEQDEGEDDRAAKRR